MKKILFIIKNHNIPSSRVRVSNLISKLEDRGYHITCEVYPKNFMDKLKLFNSLKQFDIVYLQKKLPNTIDSFFLEKLSNILIFDFDDAIYLKHESSQNKDNASDAQKFDRITQKSDIIIAGNRILADYASKLNQTIEIIPSTVETNNIPTRDYDTENNFFTIGWIGGNVNLSQMALLTDVFQKLSREIALELRVVSGQPIKMEGVNIKFIPWSLNTQEEEIAQLDVGIMPLPDSPHARGKCAYKAIQYMAAGVTPIVSDVGINADVVSHNETGLVAKEIDDFYTQLKYLYLNKERMKEMGEAARQRVIHNYSIDKVVEELDKLFKRI